MNFSKNSLSRRRGFYLFNLHFMSIEKDHGNTDAVAETQTFADDPNCSARAEEVRRRAMEAMAASEGEFNPFGASVHFSIFPDSPEASAEEDPAAEEDSPADFGGYNCFGERPSLFPQNE